MKLVPLGRSGCRVPAVAVGCMRLGELEPQALNAFLHTAIEHGMTFFDHADIYGGGCCEEHFGAALAADPSLRREDLFLQSKCGIRKGFYDSSREHIIASVEGSLRRLHTDYLDMLLIHRPDALAEPEEIAAAFDALEQSGKVRYFGVSNHSPAQIELLRHCVRQPLLADQVQFSIAASNLVAGGLEVNMETPGAPDRDGRLLDYARLHGITLQAWSPFQMPNWGGTFLGSEKYPALNRELDRLAAQYGVTPTAIAAAWVLRHPAQMQLLTGTAKAARLLEIAGACDLTLTRPEWYGLYLAAGHPLP